LSQPTTIIGQLPKHSATAHEPDAAAIIIAYGLGLLMVYDATT